MSCEQGNGMLELAQKGATLYSAILAVQEALPKIGKDAEAQIESKREGARSFKYRYASLEALLEAVVPALCQEGLVWIAKPCRDERGDPALAYKLVHAPSGEAEEGVMPLMLVAQDPKGHGSAISYARRYALLSVLNIAPGDDDDGTAAGRRAEGRVSRPNRVSASAPQQTERLATAKQRGLINVRAGEKGLPPSAMANILLAAAGQGPRTFDSQTDAEHLVKRNLDRLPGRLVDAVLERIGQAAGETQA